MGLGWYISGYNNPRRNSLSVISGVVRSCLTLEKPRSVRIACIRQQLGDGIKRWGIRRFMMSLEEILRTSKGAEIYNCHDIAHVIGKAGVLANGTVDKSLNACTTICGDGCYHGVIEGFLGTGSTIKEVVSTICRDPEQTSCFHGLGHGIASTVGDTGKSLAHCDQVEREEGKRQCGYGVLMELYEGTTADHALLSMPEDILSFCGSLSPIYRDVCQSKVGIHAYKRNGDLGKAGSLCKVTRDPDLCMNLLGVLLYWEHQESSAGIVDACRATGESYSCLVGSVEESVSIDPQALRAVEICTQVDHVFASRCFRRLLTKLRDVYGHTLEVQNMYERLKGIGILLYDTLGSPGIAVCDKSFQWGCFNGFIVEATLRDDQWLSHIDAECQKSENPVVLSDCYHGLGYSIREMQSGNLLNVLVKSLGICDTLSHEEGKKTCYNGVFRSYTDKNKKSVRTITFDPCDKLPVTYQSYCYAWQAGSWSVLPGVGVEKMGRSCSQLIDDRSRQECFSGIGRLIIARDNSYDSETVRRECAKISLAEGVAFCTIDAVRSAYSDGKDNPLEPCLSLADSYVAQCQQSGKQFACHVLRHCDSKLPTTLSLGGTLIHTISYNSPNEEKVVFNEAIEKLAQQSSSVIIDTACRIYPGVVRAPSGSELWMVNEDQIKHDVSIHNQLVSPAFGQRKNVAVPPSAGIYGISCDGVLAGFMVVGQNP